MENYKITDSIYCHLENQLEPTQQSIESFTTVFYRCKTKQTVLNRELTGGPAGPVLPSLPRAPCRGGRDHIKVKKMMSRDMKSFQRKADHNTRSHSCFSKWIGCLQRGQEVQGDLSHQEDHEHPSKIKAEQY